MREGALTQHMGLGLTTKSTSPKSPKNRAESRRLYHLIAITPTKQLCDHLIALITNILKGGCKRTPVQSNRLLSNPSDLCDVHVHDWWDLC